MGLPVLGTKNSKENMVYLPQLFIPYSMNIQFLWLHLQQEHINTTT